jgi:hypothetical protein
MFVLYLLMQDEAPDFPHVLAVAFGMSVVTYALFYTLSPLIGWFVLIPIAIVDGLVLMFFCHLTIKYAAMALVLILGLQLVVQMLMRSAAA